MATNYNVRLIYTMNGDPTPGATELPIIAFTQDLVIPFTPTTNMSVHVRGYTYSIPDGTIIVFDSDSGMFKAFYPRNYFLQDMADQETSAAIDMVVNNGGWNQWPDIFPNEDAFDAVFGDQIDSVDKILNTQA